MDTIGVLISILPTRLLPNFVRIFFPCSTRLKSPVKMLLFFIHIVCKASNKMCALSKVSDIQSVMYANAAFIAVPDSRLVVSMLHCKRYTSRGVIGFNQYSFFWRFK